MTIRNWALAVAAAAAFILPQTAMATEGAGDKAIAEILAGKKIETVDCQGHDPAQDKADGELADAAFKLMEKRDMAGLHAMLPQLEAAGNRAPDEPFVLQNCDNKLKVYGDGLGAALLAATVAAQKNTDIVMMGDLPYADLHFIIGWIYFEDKDYARADQWFVRGLKNNPKDTVMAWEHADALSRLGRCAEVMPFVDAFLADNKKLTDDMQALMLRRRGYCQGELGQHDEAIATYKQSLKLSPGNAVAEAELKWNQDQKKAKKGKAS